MKRALLLIALAAASLFAQGVTHFVSGGQQAVTATATALPHKFVSTACLGIVPGGTQQVYFGDSSSVTTSTGFPVPSVGAVCIPVADTANLYVVAANTGSTATWFGTTN